MQEDTKLITKVMKKATGADIHEISGLTAIYRNSVWLVNKGGENKKKWEETANLAEKSLRIFLATGKVVKI